MGFVGGRCCSAADVRGRPARLCRLSLTYSAFLKRIALLDTLTIAGFSPCAWRSASSSPDVPYSPWLMAFAGFFFFSFALAKRHCELMEAKVAHGGGLARRG